MKVKSALTPYSRLRAVRSVILHRAEADETVEFGVHRDDPFDSSRAQKYADRQIGVKDYTRLFLYAKVVARTQDQMALRVESRCAPSSGELSK